MKYYSHFIQVDYLFRKCYLYRHEFEHRGKQPSDRILRYSIKCLQQTHNITRTGSMNNETCQVIRETLITPLPSDGYKWNNTNITYL